MLPCAVAAGEELHFGLVHPAAFVAFAGKHVAFPGQLGQLRGRGRFIRVNLLAWFILLSPPVFII